MILCARSTETITASPARIRDAHRKADAVLRSQSKPRQSALYAINGGRDEKSGAQVGPEYPAITAEVLSYDEVMKRFKPMMEWLAKLYMNTLNVIHYMHDKYSYERIEMALHDRDILRTMACGIAGLSVARIH